MSGHDGGMMVGCLRSTITSLRPCGGCGPRSVSSRSSRSFAMTPALAMTPRMIRVGAQASLARGARMADPRRMTPEEHGEAHALLVKAVTDPDWQAASRALDDLMDKLLVVQRLLGGRGAPPQARAGR